LLTCTPGKRSRWTYDFLRRTTRDLPERGRIGICNRFYHEEVLIARVHPEILQGKRLPKEAHVAAHGGKAVWHDPYHSTRDLERHLGRNGTQVVKFFLHLSKEEQGRRFLDRIDDPDRNWKFSAADVAERNFWKDYMTACEDCLGATSTAEAPWHVAPAGDKDSARLIISGIVLDTLEGLGGQYPKRSDARRDELQAIRKHLAD